MLAGQKEDIDIAYDAVLQYAAALANIANESAKGEMRFVTSSSICSHEVLLGVVYPLIYYRTAPS